MSSTVRLMACLANWTDLRFGTVDKLEIFRVESTLYYSDCRFSFGIFPKPPGSKQLLEIWLGTFSVFSFAFAFYFWPKISNTCQCDSCTSSIFRDSREREGESFFRKISFQFVSLVESLYFVSSLYLVVCSLHSGPKFWSEEIRSTLKQSRTFPQSEWYPLRLTAVSVEL